MRAKVLTGNNLFVLVLVVITCVITLFEGSILGVIPYIYAILTSSVILFISNKKLIFNFSSVYLAWFTVSVMFFVSSLYSNQMYVSFIYSSHFLITILLSYALYQQKKWINAAQSALFVVSILVLLTVFLSAFLPNQYHLIIYPFFNDINKQFISDLLIGGYHSGIYINTGFTAYTISIGLAVVYSKLLVRKDKWKSGVLLLLFVLGLFLTGKRSFLIINTLAMITLSIGYIYAMNKGLMTRISKLFFFVVIFIVTIYITSPKIINNVLQRFTINGNIADLSQGRYDLIQMGMRLFAENPIAGNGINTAPYELLRRGLTTTFYDIHNIYIKLLSEVGVLGLLIFTFAIYWSLLRAAKLYKIAIKENTKYVNQICVGLYLQILFVLYGFFGNPISDLSMLQVYFISIAMTELHYKSHAHENTLKKGGCS